MGAVVQSQSCAARAAAGRFLTAPEGLPIMIDSSVRKGFAVTRGWGRRPWRWAGILPFGVFLAGLALAQQNDSPGEERFAPRSALQQALEGVDLAQPAQSAFRSWPSEALLRRAYWLPWTTMTFQRATLFDRPVLMVLSVPWSRPAQRMAGSVLSAPEILEAINAGFVSVYVDADRRPDVAERYRTGNWPVIAFLTPRGHPMLSQANEEKVAKPITIGPVGKEAMSFFLREGALYHEKWGAYLNSKGVEWAGFEAHVAPVEGAILEGTSDALAQWLAGNEDREHGGFGAAPKFVLPGLTEYAALRAARQVPGLLGHAQRSLDLLLASPLYDRRDGGVHRIATLPGFGGVQYEKLLDRNAALLRDLTVAQRLSPTQARAAAIAGTAAFVTGTLARAGGGFFQSQIADPQSEDGGGYWRGENAEPPAVQRLVLSGPNALAAAALARAGHALGNDEWISAAREAADLVLSRAFEPGRGARHVVEPFPEEFRFLETQAEVAFGLLDLYESTGEARFLDASRSVADFALLNLGSASEPALRDRLAESFPVGLMANPRWPLNANVTLARALLRLAVHGQGDAYRDRAARILGAITRNLAAQGVQGIEAALALEEALREPVVVTIHGAPRDPGTLALRRAAIGSPQPWTVVVSGSMEGKPAAVVLARGKEARVEDSAALAETIVTLAGPLPKVEIEP